MKKYSVLTLLLAVVATFSIHATDFTVGNFVYRDTGMPSGTVTCLGLVSGANPTTISIPGFVKNGSTTYRVRSISQRAFEGNTKATVLKVGWGVELVNKSAFRNSALKYVYLPSSLSQVGDSAFYNNSMVRVCVAFSNYRATLGNAGFNPYAKPAIVTSPGSANVAFWRDYDSDGVIEINGALANDFEYNYQYYVVSSEVSATTRNATMVGVRNGKTSIDLTDRVYNSTNSEYGSNASDQVCFLTKIAFEAFKNNTTIQSFGSASSDVTHLNYIGAEAFSGCTSLTSVYIPSGVTSIGDCVFEGCTALTAINVNEASTSFKSIQGSLYNNLGTILKVVPPGYSQITFNFPPTIVKIDDYAFTTNQNITLLELPYGLKVIGRQAFSNMKSCATIAVPASVDVFHYEAFCDMTSVHELYFNFKDIPSTFQASGDFFTSLPSDAILYVPSGYRSKYMSTLLPIWTNAFASIVDGGSYDIHSGPGQYFSVTSTDPYTDEYVFEGTVDGQVEMVYPAAMHNAYSTLLIHDKVTSLNKIYAVTSINSHAFDRYTLLRQINGGNCLKTIGNKAFKDCYNLSFVKFNNLEAIGDSAFINLSFLKTFNWSNRLTTIGDYAFEGTGFDKEISLPASVKSVGMRAFYNCSSLPSLVINNPTGGTISLRFYGNNATGFKCFVPLNSFYRFSNFATWTSNGASAANQMHPWVKPEAEWTVLSCHKPLTLPNTAQFYIVDGYDDSKQMVETEQVSGNIAALTGLLMKAVPDSVYRLNTSASGSTPYINLLKGVETLNLKVEATSGGKSNFAFNADESKFTAIDNYKYFQPGNAYLQVPTTNASTIQIDQIYVPDIIRGDVNGDRQVNVGDVTKLINMILGIEPNDYTRADLNNDQQINVGDVTTLINIILGND